MIFHHFQSSDLRFKPSQIYALATTWLIASIALMAPLDSQAAADKVKTTWYEVSVAIFKNRNSATGNERWRNPDELDLSLPENAVRLRGANGSQSSENSISNGYLILSQSQLNGFQRVKPSDPEFQQALASIKVSSNYQLLTSLTWRQPGVERGKSTPVLVQAGDEFDGLYELEGSVELTVSRYLHLKAKLWLADYVQQVETGDNWWQTEDAMQQNSNSQANQGLTPPQYGTYQGGEITSRYESIRTVVLDESRRMRSGELHYLDNPLFGMIVKVTPIKLAEESAADNDNAAAPAMP